MDRVTDATAPVGLADRPVSLGLFAGLTVTATGGPLALTAVYLPGVLDETSRSAVAVVLLGAALFVPALTVWLGYSRGSVRPGGLYGFVEAAAGRRIALVQAGLWLVSYVLYLVYTITYLAYDLLPTALPGLLAYRPGLEVATSVVIAGVALAPIRGALAVVGVIAVGQIALVAGLAVAGFSAPGAAAGSGVGSAPSGVLSASANTSLLFICASLPLFLGSEVRGGNPTVRRGLTAGWAIAVAATVVAAVPLAAVGSGVLTGEVPGMALATAAGHPQLATAVGLGVAGSVAGVVIAEFLAISRLAGTLLRSPVSRVSRVLAGVLVAGSVASLVDPQRIYDDLLKPSLVALWLSQLMVFVVYPRFVARTRRVGRADIAAASCASLLMLFGLYATIANQVGT